MSIASQRVSAQYKRM